MSDLLEDLRGGRERAGAGHLVLDRDKARDKLRKFRLPDPHYYVLQFVRAASVLGATQIWFQISATAMRCEFDAVVPQGVLDDLWSAAFGERSATAQHAANYLALGVGSAQALRPKHITIRSGDRELLVMDESERTADVGHQARTTIQLAEKFRLGHLLEFLTSTDSLQEARALRQRCRHSHLNVWVNGESVVRPGPVGRTDVTREIAGGRSRFFVEPTAEQTQVQLLKHGVGIGTWSMPATSVAGRGAVECARFPTDLSGLAVVSDHATTRTIIRESLGAYHEALLAWLSTSSSGPKAFVEALRDVCEHIVKGRADDFVTPPTFEVPDEVEAGTRELFSWLLNQPIFVAADRTKRRVSFRAAVGSLKEGAVGFSNGGFEGLARQDPPVIDVRPSDMPDGADNYQASLFRAIRSTAEVLGLSVVDRTSALQRQARRDVNRRKWESKTPRAEPSWVSQVQFHVEKMTVVIYVPVDKDNVPKPADRGLKLYVEGRLFEQTDAADSLNLGVIIDGPLPTTFSFDRVVRGEWFTQIAEEVLRRAPEVMRAHATTVIESNTKSYSARGLIEDWVCSIAQGTMPYHVLALLGMTSDQIRSVIEAVDPMRVTYDPGSHETRVHSMFGAPVAANLDPEHAIELLGSLAGVPSYRLVHSSGERRVTLAEVIREQGTYLKLAETDDYRAFLESISAAMGDHPPVVVVRRELFDMLNSLAPALGNARQKLSREVKRAMFLRRPTYDVASERSVEFRKSFSTSEAEVEVELKSWPDPGGELLILFQDRLLHREMLDVDSGNFRVIARTETLDPGLDWSVTRDTVAYRRLRETVTRVIKTTRLAWWNEARRGEPPRSGGQRRLFFEVSASAAERAERVAEPTIPAVRWDGARWERRLVSVVELRESVEESGGLLLYSRTQTPDRGLLPVPDAWVVSLGYGVPERLLSSLAGAARLSEVSISATTQSVDARARFDRRDPVPFAVPGTGFVHQTSADGLTAVVRLLPDPSAGRGEPRMQVTALHEGRALESIDIDVPFGRFRAVVRGDGFDASPSFDFVSRGRAELIAFLLQSAAETIRAACSQFADRLPGQVDAGLDAVRLDLMRMMALDPQPAPFDIEESLDEARLFQTTAGDWLRREDLRVLARGGWVPYAESGGRSDVLHVEKGEVDAHSSAIPWQLRPANEMNLPTSQRSVGRSFAHHPDPLLDAVVSQLVAARGDRFEIFDDGFARSIDWADLSGEFCRVTADGVGVARDHPIVLRVRAKMDETSIAFLASVIFSSVNRALAQIVDVQELGIQRRLLRSRSPSD